MEENCRTSFSAICVDRAGRGVEPFIHNYKTRVDVSRSMMIKDGEKYLYAWWRLTGEKALS